VAERTGTDMRALFKTFMSGNESRGSTLETDLKDTTQYILIIHIPFMNAALVKISTN